MAFGTDVKSKLEKYSKKVLIKYIMQHMFVDFGKLDLIKSEMDIDSVDELLIKSKNLNKEFHDLVQKMQSEKDPKKLVVILKEMKKTKDEIEKTNKKIDKILKTS